ncbi:hypothetical protein T492DRAFT_459687 [Pavlovales sp. CCMP2436]|nr:hypothetical protein T492DRAFT_459687 [Pavlovales sp. CCMP2436]
MSSCGSMRSTRACDGPGMPRQQTLRAVATRALRTTVLPFVRTWVSGWPGSAARSQVGVRARPCPAGFYPWQRARGRIQFASRSCRSAWLSECHAHPAARVPSQRTGRSASCTRSTRAGTRWLLCRVTALVHHRAQAGRRSLVPQAPRCVEGRRTTPSIKKHPVPFAVSQLITGTSSRAPGYRHPG